MAEWDWETVGRRDSYNAALITRLEDLLPVLRCPASGVVLLLEDGDSLVTEDRTRRYPIVNGVPLLVATERSLFDPGLIAREASRATAPSVPAKLKQAAAWLIRHPPTASRNVGTKGNYRVLHRLLRERAASKKGPVRILVVGGGIIGVDADELLAESAFEIVETDVYFGPRTLVVCDGHDLPFAAGTFDAVICQAVLEHVVDPRRVAEEISRVLEPDGYVYSEIPFMQQVHAGPFDFTRFTLLGHRRLWRYFDEVRSGAQGGPGMALIWSIMYFLRAAMPTRLWPLADRVASLLFFWLKYLDDWLVHRPGGLDAASGTFFLGRRRLTPVDDRTIVRGYRGGGRARLLLTQVPEPLGQKTGRT